MHGSQEAMLRTASPVTVPGPAPVDAPGDRHPPAATSVARRLVMSRPALARLWAVLGQPPLPVGLTEPAPEPGPDPGGVAAGSDLQELSDLGVLVPGTGHPDELVGAGEGLVVHPWVAMSVAVLGTPQVHLGLRSTLSASRPDAANRAWWAGVEGPVAASLATVDAGTFELSAFSTTDLPAELARALPRADGRAPVDQERPEPASLLPASGFRLPWQDLLAADAAARGGRDDLLPELVARLVADRPDLGWTAAGLSRQLRALSTGLEGRARLTVTTDRSRPVGLMSWVLLSGTWCALEPVRYAGVRDVRVQPVAEANLPRHVAGVLSRVLDLEALGVSERDG